MSADSHLDHVTKVIRADKKKVVPRCAFVATYIRGHKEYQDLLG